MVNQHQIGCLCENCQMTRDHWQQMGMEPALVIREAVKEAARERTAILCDADLRATWASTMAAIAAKEAARGKAGL